MRARIRAGDRAAFADLYDEHARAVYNHALRLTGNWSEAEEAMSETFLAAWRTRETVERRAVHLFLARTPRRSRREDRIRALRRGASPHPVQGAERPYLPADRGDANGDANACACDRWLGWWLRDRGTGVRRSYIRSSRRARDATASRPGTVRGKTWRR
ncbi:sigma factor [Streptomyces sp. F001]|uniref:RNA polymerase sigma factor n=1 Tax=Streptomyces sp. F001 TaxID=1510026 RepID=UPI0023EA51CB|nr:sigma factor [Streptomyces sp. F001]